MMSRSAVKYRLKSSSESTPAQSGSNPLRRNSRSISSVSVRLSSAIKIFKRSAITSAQTGRLIEHEPVHANVAHRVGEAVEIHRFDDVAVHPEMIALDDIALLL